MSKHPCSSAITVTISSTHPVCENELLIILNKTANIFHVFQDLLAQHEILNLKASSYIHRNSFFPSFTCVHTMFLFYLVSQKQIPPIQKCVELRCTKWIIQQIEGRVGIFARSSSDFYIWWWRALFKTLCGLTYQTGSLVYKKTHIIAIIL